MPTVYVLNDGGHDYSDAERFGMLVMCTTGTLDKFDLPQMQAVLAEALADSYPSDYILLTSLTSLCCVATGYMAARHGELHLLVHSSKNNCYVARSLYFDTQQEELQGRG